MISSFFKILSLNMLMRKWQDISVFTKFMIGFIVPAIVMAYTGVFIIQGFNQLEEQRESMSFFTLGKTKTAVLLTTEPRERRNIKSSATKLHGQQVMKSININSNEGFNYDKAEGTSDNAFVKYS